MTTTISTIGTTSAIEQLYVAYFKRPADPAGLAFWEQAVNQGRASLADVSAAFAASGEYKASFAGMDSNDVVGVIYQNLFGRAAEPAGVQFWAGLLDAGKISIDTVVKNIADGAQSSDKKAFANKVSVATAFTAALDTPQEQAAYATASGALHAGLLLASIDNWTSVPGLVSAGTIDATVMGMLTPGRQLTLTPGIDSLDGGAGNDMFNALLMAGSNTLTSGDVIKGSGGMADQLHAELVKSDGKTTFDISGVETVRFQAKATGAAGNAVTIDAQRMAGVTQWESYRSNADLVIEDVRISNSQSSSDIRIVMRETGTGDVDLGVYFDHYSVRSATNGSDTLRLYLMNYRPANADDKVGRTGFDGVNVVLNGTLYKISAPAIAQARSYEALALAFKDAVAKTPGLEHVVVSLGQAFDVADSLGVITTGTEIVLKDTSGNYFSTSVDTRWTASGWGSFPEPYANMSALPRQAEPVSVNIILDDVGQGGIGGDLLVTSLEPQGDPRRGPERFDIEVQDSSALQTIASPMLSHVAITNGGTGQNDAAGLPYRQGNLSVLGGSGTDSEVLPGTPAGQSPGIGFTDLLVLDASTMNGKFSFSAALTSKMITRYDFLSGASTLTYNGGGNDDAMHLRIDGSVLASNAKAAKGDFSLAIDAGAGNDLVRLAFVDDKPGWAGMQALMGSVRVTLGAGQDVLALAAGTFGKVAVTDFGSMDKLDLSALGGTGAAFAGAALSNANGSITVQAQGPANLRVADIAALYADTTTASTHVYVAVDAANIGQVYSVSDSLAGPVTVTLVGSIDLGTTAWTSLVAANFM